MRLPDVLHVTNPVLGYRVPQERRGSRADVSELKNRYNRIGISKDWASCTVSIQ